MNVHSPNHTDITGIESIMFGHTLKKAQAIDTFVCAFHFFKTKDS